MTTVPSTDQGFNRLENVASDIESQLSAAAITSKQGSHILEESKNLTVFANAIEKVRAALEKIENKLNIPNVERRASLVALKVRLRVRLSMLVVEESKMVTELLETKPTQEMKVVKPTEEKKLKIVKPTEEMKMEKATTHATHDSSVPPSNLSPSSLSPSNLSPSSLSPSSLSPSSLSPSSLSHSILPHSSISDSSISDSSISDSILRCCEGLGGQCKSEGGNHYHFTGTSRSYAEFQAYGIAPSSQSSDPSPYAFSRRAPSNSCSSVLPPHGSLTTRKLFQEWFVGIIFPTSVGYVNPAWTGYGEGEWKAKKTD